MRKLVAILFCCSLFACKKSDPQNDKAYYDMIVNKKWQPIDQTGIDSNGQSITGYWNSQPSYLLDDYYYMNSNNGYYVSDNVDLRPNSAGSTLDTGTWSLNNETITMQSLLPGMYTLPLKINSLTNDKAVVSQYDASRKLTITTTFKTIP